MFNVNWPSDLENRVVDAIRSGIGRDILFYTRTRSGCYNCTLDPVTDTSTNSFCTVCSGEGYIYTYSGHSVLAHITHNPSEKLQWVTGGKFVDGDCRVQIRYNPDHVWLLENTIFVVVDEETFEIKKVTKAGVQQPNRFLVDLKVKNERK